MHQYKILFLFDLIVSQRRLYRFLLGIGNDSEKLCNYHARNRLMACQIFQHAKIINQSDYEFYAVFSSRASTKLPKGDYT